MHIGSNIGFIAKMPCIAFLAECATINVEFTPENFTRYIQTHCKSRVILYGKLRVPSFQGGV